jgi:anion-transporting  ArsA/GET3 family ATPase
VLIDEFLAPKILIVSGKGGVGKTTVAAALALVAERNGRRVCIAEVDRKGSLPRLFGAGDLSYEPSEMIPGVWGLSLLPEEALAEYLAVQYHMRRVSRAFTSTQFVDYITTAAPGLKDILVLGKIWYLEQGRGGGKSRYDFDTIIVDAPAAGHMLKFLSAPLGLSDAVRLGPIRRQAEWLLEMVRDPKRTRVHLVTRPEEMPVTETLETEEALRTHLDIDAGPIFANAVYSELLNEQERKTFARLAADRDLEELLDSADAVGLDLDGEDLDALLRYALFLDGRRRIQSRHLKQLAKGVEQPVIELPFLFSAGLALPDIETLADVMEEAVEKT